MHILRPIAALCVAAVMAHCTDGCVPADRTAMEAAYTAETLECVHKATSLEESHTCRALVNSKYGLCPTNAPAILCPPDKTDWAPPDYPPNPTH